MADAHSMKSADIDTYADTALALSLSPPVAAIPVVEIEAKDNSILYIAIMLNPDAFERWLYEHHDKEFVKYIVDSCRNGVNIGYDGVQQPLFSENWPSAIDCADGVEKSIKENLANSESLDHLMIHHQSILWPAPWLYFLKNTCQINSDRFSLTYMPH